MMQNTNTNNEKSTKIMLKLPQGDKYALFLDHRELVNAAYSDDLAPTSERFEINPALFDFKPKLVSGPADAKESRKRKRKLKTENTKHAPWHITSDAECSTRLSLYLTDLRSIVQFSERLTQLTDKQSLPRYWEEAYTLPQLNGANATETIQKFQINDDSPVYLIPIHSRFYNVDVQQLPALLPELPQYDVIVMDPPWRNKYIRRLKHAKQELAYTMLDNTHLAQLPMSQLVHERTLVAIWCTNAPQHQTALLEQFLPDWNLSLLHACRWYKLNTAGNLISSVSTEPGQKQPYEMLYIARHVNAPTDYALSVRNVELLLSVPSIVHSHKPPLLCWLRNEFLAASTNNLEEKSVKCFELFARYLQPNCTSVGLEVLKLMDARLYELKS